MDNVRGIMQKDFPRIFSNSLLRKGLLEKIENTPMGPVLVCSMAGYGKTTLLSQLASRIQHAAVCILSHSDNDLHSFFGHLFEAIRRTLPQLEPIKEGNTGALLSQICRATLENRVTLIFDNCQVITNSDTHMALQYLMSVAGDGFRMVMGSRTIPAFAARFILEKRCLLLRREDLALSESEVGELLTMHLNVENLQLAGYLHSFTGGWAAGVMFCLQEKNSFAEGTVAWEGIADRWLIRKYITFEIFPDLPDNVVQFSKAASLLDSLDVDACENILEMGDSQWCLGYLAENDIFLHESHAEPKSFTWIEIFQRAISELLPTTEKMVFTEKAVDYFLKHKMPREAIHFALQYGKPGLICRVLTLYGESMLQGEQFELLDICARVLEKSGGNADAFVYGLLAQYYYAAGDYPKMEYNFNMADSLFGKENTYSIQRSLYRGLLRYETDAPKYLKIINNALFYFSEYNQKLPFLLPREQKILEKIKSCNFIDEKARIKKPLNVKQFGAFKVIVVEDGYEIPWRTKKGSELLAYLLSLNGKAVERSRLFDIIWPNELPNNPVATLHNMIYNIRKELSAFELQKLIQYKNKGYSVDMALIDDEEGAVSLICEAIFRKDIDTLLENEGMLSQYWGEYLENIDSMWVMEQREYYDKLFVDGSLLLGDFYFENRIYEKALVFLQNAQKVDIFSERVMEKIAKCYSRLGKFDKLRLKYEEFCNLLNCELEIQPSTDLQLAYQRSMQRKV